jgi:desampylase
MSSTSVRLGTAEQIPIAKITASAYARMLAICEAARPAEACGVLTVTQAHAAEDPIDGVLPIRNASPSPELTFQFHPMDWISTYYETQKNRQSIVGFFHSHPNASPIPSPSDEAGWLELSGHGPFTYWIVSVWDADQPECCAYRRSLRPNGSSMFAQVSVQIT